MTPGLPVPRVRVRHLSAAAGLTWLPRAWRVFRRQPFGFLLLFVVFLLLLAALEQLPPPLPLVGVALLPLLSLGFMIGTEAATNDLRVQPRFLFIALAQSAQARRSLGALGLGYLALLALAAFAGNALDGGEAERWFTAWMTPTSAAALAAIPPLSDTGAAVFCLKTAIVTVGSMALWHAPGLVYWGRQRTLPALFGSMVALWRTKAAFALFLVTWFGSVVAASLVLSVLAAVLSTVLGDFTVIIVPLLGSLALCTLFYTTLWFGFVDTFEITASAPPDASPGA